MLKPWFLFVADKDARLVITQHFTRDEARQAFVEIVAGAGLADPYGEIHVMRDGELVLEETTSQPKE